MKTSDSQPMKEIFGTGSGRSFYVLIHEASGLVLPHNIKSVSASVRLDIGPAQVSLEMGLKFCVLLETAETNFNFS